MAEQTLHPYFDSVDAEQWLVAEVVQTVPASFRFFVLPPAAWAGTIMADRVRHHMATFKLATLFTSNAANELAGIRQRLGDLLLNGGSATVRGTGRGSGKLGECMAQLVANGDVSCSCCQ